MSSREKSWNVGRRCRYSEDWTGYFSPSNTLNAELGYSREHRVNANGGLARSISTIGHAADYSGQSITARMGLTTLMNAHAFNTAVVAWLSEHGNRTPNSNAIEQFINGFGAIGGDSRGRHIFTSQQTQLNDDVTINRGHNEFGFGGHFAANPAYEQQEQNLNGRFDYNSLAAYLSNQARRFQQTFITGDTRYRGTASQLALCTDVRLQLMPNLFVTAGLCWPGQWNSQPEHPNDGIRVTARIPRDLSQWQPRIAVAWNVNSKSTVRASTGVFVAPTPATLFHRIFADSGTQTITIDSYLDPFLLIATGATTSSAHALGVPPAGSRQKTRSLLVLLHPSIIRDPWWPLLALRIAYLRNLT